MLCRILLKILIFDIAVEWVGLLFLFFARDPENRKTERHKKLTQGCLENGVPEKVVLKIADSPVGPVTSPQTLFQAS